jgi:hypothetical protein
MALRHEMFDSIKERSTVNKQQLSAFIGVIFLFVNLEALEFLGNLKFTHFRVKSCHMHSWLK